MRIKNRWQEPLSVDGPAPIRGGGRKGFIIGWFAIVMVVAIGFALAIGPLNHSSADVRLAQAASNTVSPRG